MINDLISTGRYYQADIYEQLWVSIEAIFGAMFIAIIAGFLIGLALFKLKKITGVIALFIWPFRIMLSVMGSYPIVVLAILLIPIGRNILGTSIGTEMGQFILMVWGIFFFGKMINRSFSEKEKDDWFPIKIIENIRLLLISLVAGNAVLGVLGMGGLGEMLVILAYQRFDTEFGIIVGLIYLVSVLLIEVVFWVVLTIVRTKIIANKGDIETQKEGRKIEQTPLTQNEIHNNASNSLDFLIRKK